MRTLIQTMRRWLMREDGQDILEYALLASSLGFAALAAMGLLSGAMNDAYVAWDTVGQTKALVDVPNPK